MANKRRPINLLPQINRTATLERFFGSTVDHLFQPGQTATISGYIGRTPAYNNPEVDFYKSEPTGARKKYQLEATMVSTALDGTLGRILFYDDLLARLSAEGALVSDADRLFQSEYWSWSPPIDIDKVNNFQRYYWSGDDIPAVTITMPGMEVPTITKADGKLRSFKMPAQQKCWTILARDKRPALDGQGDFPGCPVALIDGIRTTDFTILDNDTINFATAPGAASVVEVYRYGNIGDGSRREFAIPAIMLPDVPHTSADVKVFINGRPTTAFAVTGDHVTLTNPAPANAFVTVTLFDSLRMVMTGRPYFNIENITHDPVPELINGLRVRLVDPYVEFFGFDIKPAGTFKWDERRPSEFLVDGVGIAIHLMDLADSLLGLEPQHSVVARNDAALSRFSRVNRWVQADALKWFNGDTVGRQAKRPICEHLPNMAMWNYGRTRAPDADIVYGVTKTYKGVRGSPDDFGRVPVAGDIVMFGEIADARLANSFVVWPVIDDFTNAGDVTLTPFAHAGAQDVFLHTETRREWRYTGIEWLECDAPGMFPLFDLFDNNGISIGDRGEYPGSTFAGSRLFNFKVGEGINDIVLGFPVEYDTYDAIMFENDLYTKSYSYRDGEIEGFVYYLTGRDQFDNQWYKARGNLPAVGSSDQLIVPLNLQANPNFDTPRFISRNNWFAHFASIAANQLDFNGKPYSTNNWQYTQRDLSRGTHIVQSRSPMLKLMLLMADNNFDLKRAIKFVEAEYTRYKLKVRQKISENMKLGLYIDEMDEHAEIAKIFKFIGANKTADFPFFLSNIGGGQYFIPLTPAAIGITALVKPHMISENGVRFIVGHDGSKTASSDPLTDRLILAMENSIFASREDEYSPETRPYVDEYDLISGKYRKADYSRLEANVIQQSEFEDWARTNNVDYQENTTYDASNPFTWNYGSLTDRDGDDVPGNWRGIYRWYFDTETPNLTPWEMLGFVEQPQWWEGRYGTAPYPRSSAMWRDIEAGFIRGGPRLGVDPRFKRPGLMDVLPVDATGQLLDPVQARIIIDAPTQQMAAESWVFGDNSPAENLWRRSSSYRFSLALAMYLMRPAQFVEDYWDKGNRVLIHDTQWIDIPTNDRSAHSELVIHGEALSDGSIKNSFGLQTWLVEYMTQHGQTPSLLGDMVRGLDVRLAHKMAGFTTRDRLRVNAESFGVIPEESLDVVFYESPVLGTEFYSGIIVEHVGPSRWRVIGYNSLDPYFDIEPSDRNGGKIALNDTEERVVNPWRANVYYKVGMFVLHDGYVYEATKNHQSMTQFEGVFWRRDDAGMYADERLYRYVDDNGTTVRIPYTTVMSDRQDVIDFLYGYQRSLENRGFAFGEGTWDEAVSKFLNWSKVQWAGGSFLTLSPGARSISFKATQGFVMNLEGPQASGSIINRTGHLIDQRKTRVDRLDDTITVEASGDDIYGLALRRGEVEHALVFANRTIFNDIIYDTTLNVRQDRLKLSARRTQDWNGRYDAPGFVISEGQIVPNFEKAADDIRRMFDIEQADNTVLRDHARHLIGFENRPYLSNLLLNETQQFELYQGMIQQKGARGALNKIMRSRAVEGNRDLQFMEEWAFRIGEFGAHEPRGYIELALSQHDLRRQQQVIRLGSKLVSEPGVLSIGNDDPRWVSPPINFGDIVATKSTKFVGLPDAGYVRTTEATYMATTFEAFSEQVLEKLQDGAAFAAGESVWTYGDNLGRWSIKYLVDASNEAHGDFTTVDTGFWTTTNDAPVPASVNADPSIVDKAKSGSYFQLYADAREIIGTTNALYVNGNGAKTMPGTYLYSPRFAVTPGESFVASMRVAVSKGFNGVAYMAVKWFKADGTRSATEHTYTAYRDHRDTDLGALSAQREDIAPETIVVPADAYFAKVRLTVEYSNFTGNSVPALGQAVVSAPIFRRVSGNDVIRVDNHDTDEDVTGTRFVMTGNHGLTPGDEIIVAGPVGTSYEASGVFEVSEAGPNWIEIDTGLDNSPSFDYAEFGDVGPKIFKLVEGRFPTRRHALGFPLANTRMYIDDAATATTKANDPSVARWTVYSYIDPVSLLGTVVREQPVHMDASRVASALIYDQNTEITEHAIKPQPITLSSITPVDPIMGVIVGAADKEIDYKLEYDPAGYEDSGEVLWGDESVGRLWWDMSTVWFINPYTDILDDSPAVLFDLGDMDVLAVEPGNEYLLEPFSDRYLREVKYRASNWARVAPGATVDIYEWTKSYKSPDQSGLTLHPDANYVVSAEYSGTLNKEVPVYYFWVKNPTAVPANSIGRSLDAKSCSVMITDPSAAGVPWLAVISPTEMLVSGVREYLTDGSTVLQVQLQLTDEDEATPHAQWLMIRPGDAKSQPTSAMWRKLRDSLAGFDDNLEARPHAGVHASSRTGMNEKQSMFDADKKAMARDSFVTMINYQLARRNLATSQSFATNALDFSTPVQEYLIWSLPDGSRTIANLPPENLYSRDEFGQPMRTSDPAEMDEWLRDARAGTRVLLDNRFSDSPSWSVWEKTSLNSGDNYTVDIAKHYHHRVHDLTAFAELAESGGILNGEYVLVENNSDFDGFWTVVRYTGGDEDGIALMAYIDDEPTATVAGRIKVYPSAYAVHQSPVEDKKFRLSYEVVNAQTYRTSDFWEYTDWYAEDFDAANPPIITYATVADRNKHENPNPVNLFVKILDNGSGYWTWTAYIEERWITVAQQLGTVQLSDKFTRNSSVYGWDAAKQNYTFDGKKVHDRDGSHELRVMADALLDNRIISDREQNELWFSMVNFVHSTHDQVDWAFKTSFMTLVGFNEALLDEPVAKPDNTKFIMSYVDEVKPYRVTVRDFSRSYAPRTEIANIEATDFDKPGYYDPETFTYRRLDENDPADREIMSSGPGQYWLNDHSLARNIRVTMKLDRIWFKEGEVKEGAAERIMSFYQPTSGMKPKDLDTLLKLDFKGTVLDGMTFKTRNGTKTTLGGRTSDKTDINGSHDGQRGLALRDPRTAPDTPEDMVRLGAHDTILFQAKDKWGAGAPRTTVKTYDVSKMTETHLEVQIGSVARNVLVFADGMRQIEGTNYVVDYLTNNITVPLIRPSGSRVQTVTVHAFGYAAHTTVIDQTYHAAAVNGPVEVIVPATVKGDFYAEVTNNGRYVASNPSTTEGKPSVRFAGIVDAQYVITFYKGDERATTSLKETLLPAKTGAGTFSATYDLPTLLGNDLPHAKPYNSSMIIERNGLRLAPPCLYFAYQTTEMFLGDDNISPSQLLIIDDNGVSSSVTAVADSAYKDIDKVLAASRNERFIWWKGFLIFRDNDATLRKYAVTTTGTGEYNINDATGELTVNAMQSGDTIRVLHWRNDAIMQPQTWSFKAKDNGVYRIKTYARKGSSWLTINGRRLVEDVDYSVTPVVAGAWDTEAYETFRWDKNTEVNITIKNTLTGHANDLVCITTFEGPQNTPALDWEHASITPDLVRFNPVEGGERPLAKEPGAWTTHAFDLRREGGKIVADVLVGTGAFDISINALGVPGAMLAADAVPIPDAKQNVPGVVWIGAERIEYFVRKILPNGIVTLDQVRRGTKGTARQDHPAGSPVRVENPLPRLPALPLADINPVPAASVFDQPVAPSVPIKDRRSIRSATDVTWEALYG